MNSPPPGFRPIARFHVVGDEPPQPPPSAPVDPLSYLAVPEEAKAAWARLQGPLSRVRPTFAGSYCTAGRLAAAADELDAIAIAAAKAAAAIRGAKP